MGFIEFYGELVVNVTAAVGNPMNTLDCVDIKETHVKLELSTMF